MTAPVAELLPDARALAATRGQIPSIRSLMTQLRIGQPKAKKLRARLATEIQKSTSRRGLVQAGRTAPARRLTRRDIPVSGIPVSPGMPPLDPWSYAVPTRHPEAPLLSMSAPASPRPVVPVPAATRRVPAWPLLLLALPAFVAIWSGWVELGGMTGFGVVHPLPGIWDDAKLNTAITLPIGLETYGTYALWVWLSGSVPPRARRFAMWSAIGSLVLGALGQVAYHLMAAAHMAVAPWQITTIVACLPVVVVGMGAALYHLVHAHTEK